MTPPLGGVITIKYEATERASALDDYYKETGSFIGPLHCVPVLPKDNIDAKGLPTTGGVNALKGTIPNKDSDLVKGLTSQGAVVMGKANMAPLAQKSKYSWSETGGLARNPYNLSHTSYGSSGGNGVAGAAAYALINVGTDTSGSVVLPSMACNLVGLRPTLGKLSTKGMLAGNHLQDTAGPMARCAADVAHAMDAMDPEVTEGNPKYCTPEVLNKDGLRGMKVAVLSVSFYEIT